MQYVSDFNLASTEGKKIIQSIPQMLKFAFEACGKIGSDDMLQLRKQSELTKRIHSISSNFQKELTKTRVILVQIIGQSYRVFSANRNAGRKLRLYTGSKHEIQKTSEIAKIFRSKYVNKTIEKLPNF